MKAQIRRQKKCNTNIERFYKGRENPVKIQDDFSIIIYKTKYKAAHGEGLKLLTPL